MTAIHCLPIATPFAVGRVNCYLIEDEPLTLVDTGPNSGRSLDELEQALAARGRRIEDLERLVVTHQHVDHIGLAGILARRSGAEVCALELLVPVLADFDAHAEAEDALAVELMVRHGVPPDTVAGLRGAARSYRAWGGSVRVDRPLADGGTLPFAGRTFQVLHRPGHSPSDTLFWDAERALLIGGDHLLGHISSNPLLARGLEPGETGRSRSLPRYLDSLQRTRAMPVDTVLPGHGEPVTGHARLIDERFAMHERRAAKIVDMLAEAPLTAHEIARRLWGKAAASQTLLTLSEVLGHADVLLERGAIREAGRDGVVRFEPA